LGTDKVVKVWDTKTYLLIQTIIDRTQYRPSDELNSLLFDEVSKSILVGSRKINFWPFKTQEEIKTSHEYSVAFALYNT
jgi:WD40 repeat protein